MPQGEKWQSFLTVNENKSDLIQCFTQYLKHTSIARFNITIPIIITEGANTFQIDISMCTVIDSCNHKEVDSRIALHAVNSNADCVIVSKDTDVFLLLIYAYHKSNSQRNWYMKYDSDKYVDISTVLRSLDPNFTENLLKFHTLTGCDSTSFFYRVGKIKV